MELQQKTYKRAASHIPPMEELNSVEKRSHPFPIFKQLRENTPLRYDTPHEVWDAFRYEDCVRILKDPRTFSSDFNRTGSNVQNIIATDPPRHGEFRELVNSVFTPKAVQDLAPRIKEITNFLLDQEIDRGGMNTLQDVAAPLPVMVIAEMLGVPVTDRLYFKELSDALILGVEDETEETYQAVFKKQQDSRRELEAYFAQHLAARKAQPTEDLVSVLWYANLEKQVLDEKQILNFLITLLVAGHETTTNLITAMVRVLCEHPELQERLVTNPQLIPGFVEETLRYYPPVTRLPRMATEDVEIRGQVVQKGQIVNCWIAAANRDPAKFAEPDEFRPERHPNGHLTFGFGNHFCLGAPLARLEGQLSLEAILERLAELRLVEGAQILPVPYPMFVAVKEYPVTFSAR